MEYTKDTTTKLAACAALAAFWVIFLWNFWERGVYALGINAFVFGALFFWFFLWILREEGRNLKENLFWIFPLSLVFFAFLLYDNPFLKITALFVWPVSFFVFYNHAFVGPKERSWNFSFALRLFVERGLAIVKNIGRSAILYLELVIPANEKYKKIIARVLLGLVLFLLIASVVLVPLLSSADAVFEGMIRVVYDWFNKILSLPLVYRLLFAIVISVALFAATLSWGKSFACTEREKPSASLDPIVSSIVLGGILALYLAFLWIQVGRMWVGFLPFDFKTTEDLVKSGFWQLLALTVLNIFIYFLAYKRTAALVQKILAVFTGASILLLISAAHRMGMYVVFYGFSYEKFFASYVVLYCGLLFFWLISRLFVRKKTDIVKSAAVLFIWMYGIMAVFPVEQFIFRANISLSQRAGSRIRLSELSMLSPDVLGLVKKHKVSGALEETPWNDWIESREKTIADKKWYEHNVTNLFYFSGFF